MPPSPAPEKPAQPSAALAGPFAAGSEAEQAGSVVQAMSQPPPDAGLAHRTVHGLAWFLVNVVLGKGLAFVSFIVLGWVLSKEDFGVYASAFALAAFAQVFRDGGVTFLLPQRGEVEFQRIAGPVFWMALAFNIAVGLLLAAAAWPAALCYDDPRIAWILWIIAVAVPLNTASTVFTAVLQMRLQFDVVSRIGIASSIARNVSIVVLALGGAGPLSFVLPLLLLAFVEGAMGYAAVREAVWKRRPDFHVWPELFSASRWLILTVISYVVINQGAYLALSLVANTRVVGLFFFAYQLVLQIDVLLSFAVGFVLLGAFSSIKDSEERQQAAALRAARALSLIATPAAIGLAVVAAPFERLIWGGKWSEAVFAIQAIALFCVWRVVFAVPTSATQSRGLWQYNAMLLIAGGIGTVLAITLAAMIRPDVNTAGMAMGLVNLFILGGLYVLGMRRIGISPSRAISAVLRIWLIGIVAAGITAALQYLFAPWLTSLASAAEATGQSVAGTVAQWLSLDPALADTAQLRTGVAFGAGVEFLLLGTVFTKLFLVGLRLGAPGAVRDALSLAPARLRPHLERLFVIRTR